MHPLFGPVERFEGENIVLVPVRSGVWLSPLSQILKKAGLNVTVATAEEHDKAMALVQVVHHFALLVLNEMFKHPDKWTTRLEAFTTKSLRKTLKNLRRIEELIDVVEMIQRLNPYAKEAREHFLKLAHKLHKEFSAENNI